MMNQARVGTFQYEGPLSLAPLKMEFDFPVLRNLNMAQAKLWTAEEKSAVAFSLKSLLPLHPVEEWVVLPVTSRGRLASVQIYNKERTLVRGRDFEIYTHEDWALAKLVVPEAVDVRLGFAIDHPNYTPAANALDLRQIDSDRVRLAVAELKAAKLDRLASRIESLLD